MKPFLFGWVLSGLAHAAGAGAASNPVAQAAAAPPNAPTRVVAIVKVPKPWYAPRSLVVGKMRDTTAQYERLPGLQYKIFSLSQTDGQYGGIYLWKDRATAQNWFNPAWFQRVEKERGNKAEVRLMDAPVVLDNAAEQSLKVNAENTVATLVTVTQPSQIDRERLVQEFAASLPVYRQVPGLMRKYFIITDDGKFGGVYLWDSQASAQAWFNDAWRVRVRQTYGADANLEWFDVPILLPSQLVENLGKAAQ
jgi:heme-degrading monooxygenase HmoA